MLRFLKDHPFAVEAFFKSSLVLTFALPKEQLQAFIPDSLTLDTFNDQFAFLAVAMVETKGLRPKGFPAFLGNDFFLIGYRVFVRYTSNSGKRLRGLYILKSETNKRLMQIFGNIFTHYNYTTNEIQVSHQGNRKQIKTMKNDFSVEIETGNDSVSLPASSPFADWKQARRYAGPLPFTFTYEPVKQQMLIIEGVRQHWDPKPVHVINYHIPFFESLQLKDPLLANAFIIENIPYYWKKGKKEKWKP